ncbi:SKP1-like protein 4 [Solanum verrucosum]|uniref:SKP1-like protein 4 n=1 Tax=Solanum verrucosum TaxID=315347 RepID=UPI0020D0D0F8|nr:SKP1-like protein 4 [Solanum verrucosum]
MAYLSEMLQPGGSPRPSSITLFAKSKSKSKSKSKAEAETKAEAERVTTAVREEKLITFKTSDGEEFKLNEAVAVRSEVIQNRVQDVDSTSNVIPLSNVDGKTMTKVVQYWKKYSEEGVTEDQLKSFD